MIDAELVDIGVVGGLFAREILTEVEAVDAQRLRQLTDGEVALQEELLGFAMLAQQAFNIIGHGTGNLFAEHDLRDAQVLQRLYAPQQIDNKHQGAHLDEEFVVHAPVAAGVDTKHQHHHRQHHEALPHLLVLQVGEVVAQPVAILIHGAHHIYHQSDAHQQQIATHPRQQVVAAHAHAHRHHDDQRRHGHPHRPERSAPVLQHAEQHHDGHGNHQQTVEQSANEHPQRGRFIIGSHARRQVPQMPRRHDAEKRRRPQAQPVGRLHAPRKRVALPQQEVQASDECRRCSCSVEHQKQHDVER